MKVCVVTPLFALAGVPLAQIRFARGLSNAKFDVDLLMGSIDSKLDFPEIKGVRVINMNKTSVSKLLFPLMKYFRKVKPSVIFSAEDHLNIIVLLALIFTGSKALFSGSSRVTPFDTYSKIPLTKKWILKQLMSAVTWRANALTCVSQGTVNEYKQIFKNSSHVCVYNIIDDEESRKKLKEPVDHDWLDSKNIPLLIAAGRLAPWKGYADLIHAMKLVVKKKKVRLIILGDGPLRNELDELIINLELTDSVMLVGYVKNPLKYFTHAELFVHTAYVESLGNVLVEAMMCGCTVVSTNCPTGPREILQDGKFGYLVPVNDPAAMAAAIENALKFPISSRLLEEAVKPFVEDIIIEKHFEALGISFPELQNVSNK